VRRYGPPLPSEPSCARLPEDMPCNSMSPAGKLYRGPGERGPDRVMVPSPSIWTPPSVRPTAQRRPAAVGSPTPMCADITPSWPSCPQLGRWCTLSSAGRPGPHRPRGGPFHRPDACPPAGGGAYGRAHSAGRCRLLLGEGGEDLPQEEGALLHRLAASPPVAGTDRCPA
jgi:hypothetical protein